MSQLLPTDKAKLVLATHNEHKVRELLEILQPVIPMLDRESIVSAGSLGIPDPVEDAADFVGNALLKARAVSRATGLPAIADDSGLCVDIMNGAPGIFSARWAGQHGDDKANLELLLQQLQDIPDHHRGAQFSCAAVLVTPDGREYAREGIMRGSILRAPQGENGFGYDPIFCPEGMGISSAQLSLTEKDEISHRGKAFRALAPLIAEELNR